MTLYLYQRYVKLTLVAALKTTILRSFGSLATEYRLLIPTPASEHWHCCWRTAASSSSEGGGGAIYRHKQQASEVTAPVLLLS